MSLLATYSAFKPCLCGSNRSFGSCCRPLLTVETQAASAEALMRSRYVGYALRDESYVLATWHPRTRPKALNLATDETRWLGLRIRRSEAGGPDDRHGTVEFVAEYRLNGFKRKIHETSEFERADGRWLYVDGVEHALPGRA
jgi:SEC-C motif domain protein